MEVLTPNKNPQISQDSKQLNASPEVSNASTEKNSPPRERLSFPELRCSVHKSPVILVCTRPECTHRIFLCAKCVSLQLTHINEHDPLLVYDDFIDYLSRNVVIEPEEKPVEKALFDVKIESVSPFSKDQPTRMEEEDSTTKSVDLISRKEEIIRNFRQNLDVQKQNMLQTVKMFQGLYMEKCEELTEKMKEVFDSQGRIFAETFENFEQEFHSDKQRDADIPSYDEIRKRVLSITDLKEIEGYLTSILRKKQTWQTASEDIKSLSRRTEEYYRGMLQQQLEHPPKFLNPGTVIGIWTVGLSRIIEQITGEESIYENLFRKPEGVEARISSVQELNLFTNKMLKQDTVLNFNLERKRLSFEDCKLINTSLGRLTNLGNLILNLEQVKFVDSDINAVFEGLPQLESLTKLSLCLFGLQWQRENLEQLSSCLGKLRNLTALKINIGENCFQDEGAVSLIQAICQLPGLTSLSLDLSSNNITTKGAQVIAEHIVKLRNLNDLTLQLGGYSLKRNNLKDEGVTHIARSLRNLPFIRKLELDFSHNSVTDNGISEVCLQLRDMNKLEKLALKLSHNSIQFNGAKKLGKCFSRLPSLRSLELTGNTNEFGLEGAQELVLGIRRMSELKNLKINLRNSLSNAKKEKVKQLKDDLSSAKIGKPLENLEFLF